MFRAVPGLANTWEPHASINVFNASRAKHILQDTVYTSTMVRAVPKLPSSIRMLATANNKITTVPVLWQPLPPGATDRPGEVTVTGTTGAGPVTAVIDVMPSHSEHDVTTS
jgi:arabinogalactan endo-1,4-beta-galactosidase